jgi:hypothetical protein
MAASNDDCAFLARSAVSVSSVGRREVGDSPRAVEFFGQLCSPLAQSGNRIRESKRSIPVAERIKPEGRGVVRAPDAAPPLPVGRVGPRHVFRSRRGAGTTAERLTGCFAHSDNGPRRAQLTV